MMDTPAYENTQVPFTEVYLDTATYERLRSRMRNVGQSMIAVDDDGQRYAAFINGDSWWSGMKSNREGFDYDWKFFKVPDDWVP